MSLADSVRDPRSFLRRLIMADVLARRGAGPLVRILAPLPKLRSRHPERPRETGDRDVLP